MKQKLHNIKVAVLVCDGFEEVELTKPIEVLKAEGATVHVISPNVDNVKAWNHDHWTKEYKVDVKIADANPSDYDAVLLPGGVMNPDKLRTNQPAIKFLTSFFDDEKPIAAICHGPWSLIETGKLRGRKLTSYHSIKTDLKNAGANWQDEEVVEDGYLVTSRSPKDLPAFNKKIVEIFAKESRT